MKLPSLSGIRAAAERLTGSGLESPVLRSEGLSRRLQAQVYLKLETLSPVGSFKLRGALNALLQAKEAGDLRGAVTSSTGNHGLGVAWSSRQLGIPCHIFLQVDPNPLKRDRIASLGAEIHEVGRDLDEAKEAARAFAEEHDQSFVDDGESLGVIEGAGCLGLELAEQVADLHAVFAPTGSGSLVSGVAVAVHASQPDCQVIAVQSQGSPAMTESYKARRAIERPIDTCADGLACRVPADLALGAMLENVDDAMLVSDAQILAAVQSMLLEAQVLCEPSAAASLAAAHEQREKIAGKRIALLVTGANITGEYLRQALAGPGLFED
ncbi:MAG: threonine ammonia-lyase [Planctomycetota bacterium]|jgi:threonine dehydratase